MNFTHTIFKKKSPCTFVLVVQARKNSTRLKQKIFQKIGNCSMLEFLQKRLLTLGKSVENYILAVPDNDLELFSATAIPGFRIISGSEENVLSRFHKGFSQFPAEYLIRATADNPLVSLAVIKKTISFLTKSWKRGLIFDYIYHADLPLGSQTEFVSKQAFLETVAHSKKNYEIEHVTPYIYEHPEKFKIKKLATAQYKKIKNIRITVDTSEDLTLITNIIKRCGKKDILADLDDIEKLYESDSALFDVNKNIVQKNYRETA